MFTSDSVLQIVQLARTQHSHFSSHHTTKGEDKKIILRDFLTI